MIFSETKLSGTFTIIPEHHKDERGFFARTFCEKEFARQGLSRNFVQCNISFNNNIGTLRGMHYQLPPFGEAKLVRCTKGAIYDVVIDLRVDSPTFKQWVAFELTEYNRNMVYIPENLAHGFLTLTDDTEVFYQMSEIFTPQAAAGVRYNDPAFTINWPAIPNTISDKDKNWLDFSL